MQIMSEKIADQAIRRLLRPGKRHDLLVHSENHLSTTYFVLGTGHAKSILMDQEKLTTYCFCLCVCLFAEN